MHKSQGRNTTNRKEIKNRNTTPPKGNNSTIIESNVNELDEISDKEFKVMIISIIHEN
jgi:hypothetical protein